MKSIRLVEGQGSLESRRACWMTALHHYTSDKGWSDHPECVSPVVTALCIRMNDALSSDEARGRIIGPHLFAPVGTRTTPEDEQKRMYLCANRAVKVFAVSALRSMKRPDLAEQLVAIPDVVDRKTALVARDACYRAACAGCEAEAAYAAAAEDSYTAASAAADAAVAAAAIAADGADAEDKWLEDNLLPLILECCEIGRVDVKEARTIEQVYDFICV